MHDGQNPRDLQAKGTRSSSPQVRHLLRPPFAHDAVTALPDGRVRVSFKAPWRSGTAYADMDAQQFLARLYALVRRTTATGR